jgi:vancomycin resistance protein YoaR
MKIEFLTKNHKTAKEPSPKVWCGVKYIFIGLVILAPKLVSASTVSFDQSDWVINSTNEHKTQDAFVRNNISLKNLSAHILLNKPMAATVPTLDSNSVSQIENIIKTIDRPAVDAQMTIKDGWATTFVPDQNGQAVDVYKLSLMLAENLDQIDLPVITSIPQVKLADLNSIGVKELVARGESDFSGSSKNRIVNVTVGSSKYNGLILQPGQEFSFNNYLGDIDAAHGFKPEQVIKASGIELEFGGGLCQVSTTMFRAAMLAGFPITQRRNHSFAVHYYSPQGTDATIYPGSSDLKFVNNFTSPVVIRTYVDAPHVYFEVYGTKDDRVVTLETPVQFDRKSDGSMKATWTRHVTINGQTTDYVAKSTYVSPNLYKKVDQVATPNPQAQVTPANTTTPPDAPTT